MKKAIISFLLIFVLVSFSACGLLSGLGGGSVKALQKKIEKTEVTDNTTAYEALRALYELREKDEAACADSAYIFLTNYDYDHIYLLSTQVSPESVGVDEFLSDYIQLCEDYGYSDAREVISDRICETADTDNVQFLASELCGISYDYFKLFLPKMIKAGWFTLEEGNPWTDNTISKICEPYLTNAGDKLGERLAFISQEVIPYTGVLTEIDPISWKKEVPESDAPARSGKAGACMVISRATGSANHDHDWQIELPIYFSLPEENRISEDGHIDTLILLDTSWEEYTEYGQGDGAIMAHSEITYVQLIDAETGVPLCEKERFRDNPGTVIMSNGAKNFYHIEDYIKQEKLMKFIMDAVK